MVVREILDDEAGVAGELVVAAYRALEDSPPVDDEGYAAELREVARRASEAVVLVAVDEAAAADQAVVGCVTYVPEETSPLAEDLRPREAGLRMLAVSPLAQRRGVGRALVEACVDRARRDGKERLFLHSGTWMRGAHRLYESLGFRRVPERDWAPEPGIPLLAYALELRG
jgi:ribosomal protein S18 acetylase RimI-like enzyme